MVDLVYLTLGAGIFLYVAQAAVLGGRDPRQMFRRLYSDTSLGFVIVLLTGVFSLYFMKTSGQQYFILPTVIGFLIGATLERKLSNFFQLGG